MGERVIQPRFRGWRVMDGEGVGDVAGRCEEYVARNTPTPETGLGPHIPSRSYHVMAGYAYINPLAGLTPPTGKTHGGKEA